MKMSHYTYLDKNLPKFINDIIPDAWSWNCGIITAHGDKFYGYQRRWENAGIHFFHGCMIMMLTYITPFSNEVRTVRNNDDVKWVDPANWVIENYERFKSFLPKIEEHAE